MILPQVLIKPNKSIAVELKEMASFHHRRETRGSTLLSRARDRGQKLLSRCIYIDRIDRLNYSQQRIISRGRTFVRREISDNYAIPGRESRKERFIPLLVQLYPRVYELRRKLGIKTIIEECPRRKSIMFR